MTHKNPMKIATLGSHSALQILKGAKEEGFETIAICEKGRERLYQRFKVADEIILVDKFPDLLKEQDRLKGAILIPHGTLVASVDLDKLEVPVFGSKECMKKEASRKKQQEWFKRAGIRVPKEYPAEKMERLSIAKFPGARGGKGYFLCRNKREFEAKGKKLLKEGVLTKKELESAFIQEYIIGVNFYLTYFNSPLTGEVELFGMDRRYETNADGLARIPAKDQDEISPSYVVVGNTPLVARESLLDKVFEMGESIAKAEPGMIGPYCLETMCTDAMEFIAFEISARIVAGTNLYTQGSPYSYLQYGPGMSMGRRIAMEIRKAIEQDKLDKVVS